MRRRHVELGGMKVFVSPVTDPMVNMGLESFFLNLFEGEGCLVYRNASCVVIGKNQNPYREVDVSFCKRLALPVLRRISGGGTVYHDLGNINTAFFGKRSGIADNLYERWTESLIAFLKSLRLVAERDGRNGLELLGRKISGSAQALKQHRFLHHATLLFSSDLVSLEASIHPIPGLVEGRGISSHRSPVTNILNHWDGSDNVDFFQSQLVDFLLSNLGQAEVSEIPNESGIYVQECVKDQFDQWEWNIARTPPFQLRLPVAGGVLVLDINNGIIRSCVAETVSASTHIDVESLVGESFVEETLFKKGIAKICPDIGNLIL